MSSDRTSKVPWSWTSCISYHQLPSLFYIRFSLPEGLLSRLLGTGTTRPAPNSAHWVAVGSSALPLVSIASGAEAKQVLFPFGSGGSGGSGVRGFFSACNICEKSTRGTNTQLKQKSIRNHRKSWGLGTYGNVRRERSCDIKAYCSILLRWILWNFHGSMGFFCWICFPSTPDWDHCHYLPSAPLGASWPTRPPLYAQRHRRWTSLDANFDTCLKHSMYISICVYITYTYHFTSCIVTFMLIPATTS